MPLREEHLLLMVPFRDTPTSSQKGNAALRNSKLRIKERETNSKPWNLNCTSASRRMPLSARSSKLKRVSGALENQSSQNCKEVAIKQNPPAARELSVTAGAHDHEILTRQNKNLDNEIQALVNTNKRISVENERLRATQTKNVNTETLLRREHQPASLQGSGGNPAISLTREAVRGVESAASSKLRRSRTDVIDKYAALFVGSLLTFASRAGSHLSNRDPLIALSQRSIPDPPSSVCQPTSLSLSSMTTVVTTITT